ncbi:hypothetical protein ACFYP4_02350 [Streptomyces sp. NPDC005551]|uniref:hypothetical protein n=1 Tax=Streptomyces sp. NPDC005551 TaxID=3364725 RepID=UPI0036B15FBC
MTKWLGWPEASEHGGHMIKRVSDPDVKVTDDFKCQDCGTRGDAAVFAVGHRGCPGRPESLNYLTIRDFKGVESMSIDEQRKAAREQWLDFAKRVGMGFRTLVEGNDKYNNVLLTFVMGDVIYALNYDEKTKGLEAKKTGKSHRMEAAE